MSDQTTAKSPLQELRDRRSALQQEIESLIEKRDTLHSEFQTRSGDEDEDKRPSEDETREFNAAHSERRGDIRVKLEELRELDERVEEQVGLNSSREIAERASVRDWARPNGTTREPLTYREDNQHERSYFLDLAAQQNPEVRGVPNRKLEGYQERLQRHAKEMAEEMPRRWAERRSQADQQVDQAEREVRARHGLRKRGLEESPFERQARLEGDKLQAEARAEQQELRAPSRIVGQGGYAIPPMWLIDEYIPALRPGRVAAGLCRQMPLPEGTDSINIPRLLTPTLTAVQGADAAPVASRDFSDTFQQANVKTVAGQEDVPIQLIEQSPGQILDRVLMTDLIADYNKQVDVQVLVGNGVGAPLSGGQVVGIYPAANWGATTVSIAALGGSSPYVPAQAEFFQFLGALASKASYSRFNLSDFNYVMHPRRHFWSATGLDQLGRPLGSDDGFGPTNSHEVEINPAPYEGYAGRLPFGPRVYIDANVPITDNGSGAAGGTNDVVIGAIWDDLWLFEGDLRTRVLAEVLSGTLELRFQIYAYIAFLARYGVSIALGYGSPLGQPYTYSGSSNGAAF